MIVKERAQAALDSFTCERRRIPLVVPFAITGSSQDEADAVFLCARDADGLRGWGEASPLPIVTGDTVPGALAFLQSKCDELRGKSVHNALRIVQEQWRAEFAATQTSALCAIESALYDLLAKQSSVPLRSLWHVGSADEAQSDITVPALPAAQLEPFWTHFAGHGFSTFKVKVTGENVAADCDRSLEAWRHLPPGGSLILDGNQGFSADKARRLLAELEKAGAKVQFFEQPFERGDDKAPLEFLATSGTPLCLDESVRTLQDFVEIAGAVPRPARARLLVNLKIMKSGVHESLLIGLAAQRMGCGLMIGGMMETDLAMTCSLHLNAALGGVRACDLDTPFYLRTLACAGSPYAPQRALLRLPVGPGLGVEPVQAPAVS